MALFYHFIWKNSVWAIGGTVKQLAAFHSLKATSEGHIVTPFEFYDYDWAKNKVAVIRFLYVEKESEDLLKPGQDIKFSRCKDHIRYIIPCICAQGWGTLLIGNISQDINTDMCSGLEYIWLNLLLTLYCQIQVNTSWVNMPGSGMLAMLLKYQQKTGMSRLISWEDLGQLPSQL